MQAGSVELSLPALWWRETKLAEPLALTAGQLQQLEALTPKQENAARLESETTLASRELRTILDLPDVTSAQIVESGQRLRDARAAQFDAQIDLLASERAILTNDQWSTLKRTIRDEIRSQRSDERGRGGRGGHGGRGGFGGGPGGGGRQPGW